MGPGAPRGGVLVQFTLTPPRSGHQFGDHFGHFLQKRCICLCFLVGRLAGPVFGGGPGTNFMVFGHGRHASSTLNNSPNKCFHFFCEAW